MSRPPRDAQTESEAGGLYSRWSRRKQESREHEAGPDPADAAGAADVADAVDEKPVLTDADMPPLDSIDENTEVKDFFSPGVSETLRKAALNKLFHLPMYNIVDGLDDYDDDFRTFDALGDLITADMRHRAEMEAERAEQAAADAADGAGSEEATDTREDAEDAAEEPDAGDGEVAAADGAGPADPGSDADMEHPAPVSSPPKDAGAA